MAGINPDGTIADDYPTGTKDPGMTQSLLEIIKNRKEDNHEGK